MKKTLITGMIAASMFCACNNSDSTVDTKATFDSSLANSATKNAVSAPATDTSVQIQHTAVPGNNTAIATAPATTTTGVATAGLNPAHGQPGHRCDIAVGAPLNSPAAKPATTATTATTTSQPVITSTPGAVAAPVKTAPGMNPPHGQPGHRCDIAVGAPLNSPVTKPATVTKTVSNPVPVAESAAPPAAPVTKDSTGK